MMKHLPCLLIVAVVLTGCTGETESESRKEFAKGMAEATQLLETAYRGFTPEDYLNENQDDLASNYDHFQSKRLEQARTALAKIESNGSPEQTVAVNVIRAEILAAEAGRIAEKAKFQFFASPLIKGDLLLLGPAYEGAATVPDYVKAHDEALQPIIINPDAATPVTTPRLISASQASLSLMDMIDAIEDTLFISEQYANIDYAASTEQIKRDIGAVNLEIDTTTTKRDTEQKLVDKLEADLATQKQLYQTKMTESAAQEQLGFRGENPKQRFEHYEKAALLKGEATQASNEADRIAGELDIAKADLKLAEIKLSTAQAKLNALKNSEQVLNQRQTETNKFATETRNTADSIYEQFKTAYQVWYKTQIEVIGPPAEESLMGQATAKLNEAIVQLNKNVPGVEDREVTATLAFHLGTKQLEQGAMYLIWADMEQQTVSNLQLFVENAKGLTPAQLEPIKTHLSSYDTTYASHMEEAKLFLNSAITALDTAINTGASSELTLSAKQAKLATARLLAGAGEAMVGDSPVDIVIRDLETELAASEPVPAPPADTTPTIETEGEGEGDSETTPETPDAT